MTEHYQFLKEAFLAKKTVKFFYEGHFREAVILQLGWTDGQERCFTEQIGGTSGSPSLGYRCFFVENMSQLELGPDLDETKSAEEVEEAALRSCISEPDPSLKC